MILFNFAEIFKMKKIAYLLIFSFLIYSCSSSLIKEKSSNTTSLFQEWIFTNSERNFIKFDEKTNKISGFSGCNQFFGSFEYKNNILKINSISSTKMYCPEIKNEQNFLNLLQQTTSFRVEQNKLYLYKDKLELLTFSIK